MSKKFALINPPSPFLIDERVFPNLGILYVATAMKKEGLDVELFDLCGVKDYQEIIKNIAKEFDFFGFSSTSPQFIYTHELLHLLKELNPHATTLIGGAHASAMSSLRTMNPNDENMKYLEEFDIIVEGEAESGLEAIFNKEVKWKKLPLIKDIDSISIPNRNLMDIKSYKYDLGKGPTTTVMTQRGCPFGCSFCSGRDIDMYRKSRRHSSQRVLEEMDYMHDQFGFSSFMWFDDEINVNPTRLMELGKALSKRSYFHRGFVRADLLVKHSETPSILRDAGFMELCFGVESGSDKVLKNIHKGTSYEINLKAAELIKNAGLRLKVFGIIGHPGENYDDVMLTKRWLSEAKPNSFDYSILSPYPGSKIYDFGISSSKFPDYRYEWNNLYFNKPDFSKKSIFYKGRSTEYDCMIRTEELSAEEILKLRNDVEEAIKKEN